MSAPFGAINPQLAPVGFGQDFSSLEQSDPLFAQAWNQVYSQMQSDGTAQLNDFQSRVSEAQTAFTDAYHQMVDNSMSSDPQAVVNAARDMVLVGKTVGGAISTVQGLLGGGPVDPAKVTNLFVGSMIGIGVLAGAVSAGVGSAIIGGFAAVVGFLESLGTPPSAGDLVQICSTYQYGTDVWVYTESNTIRPLKFTVGCVGVYPETTVNPAPGSPAWRQFPNPANTADAPWFEIGQLAYPGDTSRTNSFEWNKAYWNLGYSRNYNTVFYPANTNIRPIDAAFPEYRYLECELSQGAVSDFQRAFFKAWKANREYALNGLTPQPDAQVLVHALKLWNASHYAGPNAEEFVQRNAQLFQGGCPGNLTPYLESLVDTANSLPQANEIRDPSTGGFVFNDGPLKMPGLIKSILGGSASSTGWTTGQTVAAVVGGTAAATAAGIGVYAWMKHKAYSEVAGQLWKNTGGRFFRRR